MLMSISPNHWLMILWIPLVNTIRTPSLKSYVSSLLLLIPVIHSLMNMIIILILIVLAATLSIKIARIGMVEIVCALLMNSKSSVMLFQLVLASIRMDG